MKKPATFSLLFLCLVTLVFSSAATAEEPRGAEAEKGGYAVESQAAEAETDALVEIDAEVEVDAETAVETEIVDGAEILKGTEAKAGAKAVNEAEAAKASEAVNEAEAGKEAETGKGAETEQHDHTVIKGDTLWDLSESYLKDPFLWPDIWKVNPRIKDPDLIYPGENIVIPGIPPKAPAGEAAAEAAAEAPPVKAEAPEEAEPPVAKKRGKPEPFVNMGKTILRMPKKADTIMLDTTVQPKTPIATKDCILAAGFIDPDPDPASVVAGSPYGSREIYSLGDELYVETVGDFKKGERLTIIRLSDEVEHPDNGDNLGHLVRIIGNVRLKDRTEEHFLAVVEDAYAEIRIDDYVIPYVEPLLVYDPIPSNPALKGISGYVVTAREERVLNDLLTFVYIDMGSGEGVKPGDRFIVKRTGGTVVMVDDGRNYTTVDTVDDEDMVEVGEVQVISVQQQTATAQVLDFREPIRPGYSIHYKD